MITNIESLIRYHVKMQSGCYFSGTDKGPRESQFLWSERIPDTAWNFAVNIDASRAEEVQWLQVTAKRREREPALLAITDDQISHLSKLGRVSASPEHWMTCGLDKLAIEPHDYAELEIESLETPCPQNEFLEIFMDLFEDSELNAHFKAHYVPTLQHARAVSGVEQSHFVGWAHGQAVTCASIYIYKKNAALYNVGTRVGAQKRGYGRQISLAALAHAIDARCHTCFLQCEEGTHVEHLYKKIGFSIAATPSIVVLEDA